MMRNTPGPGAYDALGTEAAGYRYHRPRASPSPRADQRRVIFPSLHHGARSPSRPQPKALLDHPTLAAKNVGRDQTESEVASPTEVGAIIDGTRPILLRANSLDGISIPLPRLSLDEDTNAGEGSSPIAPRSSERVKAQVQVPIQPVRRTAGQSGPPNKWASHPSHGSSSFDTTTSKPRFFGEVKHKTYYPATSIPTPVSDKNKKKPPAFSELPPPILRRKTPFSPTTLATSRQGSSPSTPSACSSSEEGGSVSPPRSSQSTFSPNLSPGVPTLASPSRIESLKGDPQCKPSSSESEGIGDSEYDLERLSSSPKVLPRKQCISRIQSDTIVTKNNEEEQRPRRDSFATSSSHDSVSRHASLECLSGNKKVSFDPHIQVVEFPITAYETKGGDKWFTEDQLEQFKQEAMQRIRLRSMKVIPTGTGRALAIATRGDNDKGRASSATATEGKSKGSVSFNHPALGCDDDIDLGSRSSREDAIKGHLSQEIRNVLVVDPHEIFLSLFTKSLKHMIPHAAVATARSSEEAMTRIEAAQKAFPRRDGGSTCGFDVVIIEERLRSSSFSVQHLASGPHTSLASISTQTAGDDSAQRFNKSSGSALIRHLVESELKLGESRGGSLRSSLLIGVTSRLADNQIKLETAGADCVWSKPPPEMNASLRNSLLKLLMKKRNRTDLQLFD